MSPDEIVGELMNRDAQEGAAGISDFLTDLAERVTADLARGDLIRASQELRRAEGPIHRFAHALWCVDNYQRTGGREQDAEIDALRDTKP